MIAKNIILLLLLIIVPDVYLYWRYLRRHPWWTALLWFVPSVAMAVATVLLSRVQHFVPENICWVNAYLFLLGLIPVAKLLFALASFCGRHGWKIGVAAVLTEWGVLCYGSFVEPHQLEVRKIEIAFDDLPDAFDGYRIVHFSDLHLGSSSMEQVCQLVDSINAQQADMVVFTGDIQNQLPDEIEPYVEALSAIKAKDGIYSVQGNHDYAGYTNLPYYVKAENEERTVGLQQDMGWKVLSNYHRTIVRGTDAIVLAGMENDGVGHFPQKGNINNALWGVSRDCFVVMLEHDPSCWRRKILPHCHAQLTLSGHTHGLQFRIFGWSPLALFHDEVDGLYCRGKRYLFVSKGVGGVIPFRVDCAPEIVVITLTKAHNS